MDYLGRPWHDWQSSLLLNMACFFLPLQKKLSYLGKGAILYLALQVALSLFLAICCCLKTCFSCTYVNSEWFFHMLNINQEAIFYWNIMMLKKSDAIIRTYIITFSIFSILTVSLKLVSSKVLSYFMNLPSVFWINVGLIKWGLDDCNIFIPSHSQIQCSEKIWTERFQYCWVS